ncbi:MAG TPA: Hpt domain-containing protein [Thiobacillaceae bacterium]|nr:Hpt domain-containing protein [Thiobacillaceae bacterium]
MSTMMEYDTGPLNWVRGEIDKALKAAQERIQAFRSDKGLTNALRLARSEVHQASGAIRMVGLEGAATLCAAMEEVLDGIDDGSVAQGAGLDALASGLDGLSRWMARTAEGRGEGELALFPFYRSLRLAQGAERVFEGEMFFPDLQAQSAAPRADAESSPEEFRALVKSARSAFQRGLLAFLKGTDAEQGLGQMRSALARIESAAPSNSSRTFWWACAGFVDALLAHGVEADFHVKQLLARIDLQMRHLLEGSPQVAERLMRDALFFIAKSQALSNHGAEVKSTFNLDRYLPKTNISIENLVRLRPVIDALKDELTNARNAWHEHTENKPESHARCLELLGKFHRQAAELGVPALQSLLDQLQQTASVPAAEQPEALNLEIATTLLFLQQALESEDVFSKDFASRADNQSRRLQAVAGGQALPEDSMPLMDEGSRQAREHAIMGQLGQEVSVNLQRMEEILDTFFRNPENRDELPLVNELAQQVNGALAMLDQLPASLLLDAAMDLIGPSVRDNIPLGEADQHRVADALSSLGLFVNAHCAGRSDASNMLDPVLKIFGLIPAPAPVEEIHRAAAKSSLFHEEPAVADSGLDRQATHGAGGEEKVFETPTDPSLDAGLNNDNSLDAVAEQALSVLRSHAFGRDSSSHLNELACEDVPTRAAGVQAPEEDGCPSVFLNPDLAPTASPHAEDLIGLLESELPELIAPSVEPVTEAELFCPMPSTPEQVPAAVSGHEAAPAAEEPGQFCLIPAALEHAAPDASDHEPSLATEDAGLFCPIPAAAEHVPSTVCDHEAQPPSEEAAPLCAISSTTEPMPPSISHPQAGLAAEASAMDGVDPELLEIFLQEAQEVLENLAQATAAGRDNCSNGENLGEIRRAFHTLKGSSRMVGLADFGEAAWGMEELMNSWLGASKPASTELLDLVDEARQQFDLWVSALQENQSATPNMTHVLGQAARLANGKAAVEEIVEPATPPEDVRVGSISLSLGLYQVFLQEAAQRLQALHDEMARLAEQPQSPIANEASRAAHTLGGIAATAGFTAMADLAHVLEVYWRKLDTRAQPGEALAVVHAAVNRLDDMLAAISAWQEPSSALDLIETLAQLPCTETSLPASVAIINEEAAETPEQATPLEDSVPANGSMREISDLASAPASSDSIVEEHAFGHKEFEQPEAGAVSLTASPLAGEVSGTEPASAEDFPPDLVAEPCAPQSIAAQPLAGLPSTPSPVFEKRAIQDEIDTELLPIFLEEAETLVPDAAANLRAWKDNIADNRAPAALRRVLHTLKGSARMAGANRLGELTHAMESRVIDVLEGRGTADQEIEALEAQFDRVAETMERLHQGPEVTTSVMVETPVTQEEVMLPQDAGAPDDKSLVKAGDSGAAAQAPAASGRDAVATLRVRADWVDRMVNQAGEVSIARSRIESEVFGLKRHVVELAEALNRLRTHIREVEIQAEAQMQATFQTTGRQDQFDPLEFDRFTRFQEVTRFVAESVNDISTVQHTLLGRLGETQAALTQQARMNRELQQNLLRVRMVPIYSIAERLYRVVRKTARELGKRAQIDIHNGELELDRSVLEKVTAPLEHLLRNAIAHGLENPQGRSAAGKPEFGEITLSARQEGNEIVLTLKDDGAGLNLEKIRAKCEALGLLSHGMEPTDAQLAYMIFQAGFSTADHVTAVAGRGVGMDVVKSEITALGGRVEVASESGKGVTFTIYLPLTLAVAQAVIITAGRQDFALPTTMVGQVQELKPEQLSAALAAGAVEWRGTRYPLFYLPHLLGQMDATHEIQRFNSVVLMKSGSNHAAFLVDQVQGAREIVVKNIGPQLARISGIAGATVQGDGRIMLILNPMPLALRAMQSRSTSRQIGTPAPILVAEKETTLAPLVMVVDDSLTVRKITGRLLLREGYRMESAKDGVDALEKMHDLTPDLVLLDVEMPRMDGFELARIMRSDPILKHVPIIMITSRTADKHRSHAMEIGVNVYLGKPYHEALLLGHIGKLLGEKSLQPA